MATAMMAADGPRLALVTARKPPDPRRHERNLLAAIVEQALADARQYGAMGLSGPAIDAVCWLLSASEQPFSFRWICRMLDVSPGAAQERVTRLRWQ